MSDIEVVKESEGVINRLWIREEVGEDRSLVIVLMLNGKRIIEIKNGYLRSVTNHGGLGISLKEYLFQNNEIKEVNKP